MFFAYHFRFANQTQMLNESIGIYILLTNQTPILPVHNPLSPRPGTASATRTPAKPDHISDQTVGWKVKTTMIDIVQHWVYIH